MKSKAWLTIFGVIAFLLVGGAAFFAISTAMKYTVSRDNWDNRVETIVTLERKKPYPREENVEILKEIVSEYKDSVDNLFVSLNQFQKPLNQELKNIEFQDFVKGKVSEFRELASNANFEIVQNDSFELGFNAYSNSLPTPEIVPILDYELKAIDHLLRTMVSAGAESMHMFSRDLIPGEEGGPAQQESGVVHKYPVRLGFTASHNSYQSLMNSISNDSEYFYIVRVLEVQNEVKDGPLKDDDSEEEVVFVNNLTGEAASEDQLIDWGYPDESSIDEVTSLAEAEGFVPSGRDARVLMGQEKLRVFMVVDIVRFLDPSGTELADLPAKSGNNRRARR